MMPRSRSFRLKNLSAKFIPSSDMKASREKFRIVGQTAGEFFQIGKERRNKEEVKKVFKELEKTKRGFAFAVLDQNGKNVIEIVLDLPVTEHPKWIRL